MALSTHVLDLARGVPAADVAVELYAVDGESRSLLSSALTNADGRIPAPFGGDLKMGFYELVFAAGAYFAHHDTPSFFTDVAIRFRIDDAADRYHVPLLLAPWGYSTYRGS
jgi:5-hydroxyisourate hydrolase